MKLKKLYVAIAATLPLLGSFAANAADVDKENRVFGSIFTEYYMPDTDKTESPAWDYMKKDWGYGLEIGYYLNETWALRAEYARLEMQSKLNGSDVNGNRFGIDAMYHLPQMPSIYIVGGLKRFDAARNTTAVNVGVGYKHFFNQNFALYAEGNRYQGIDKSYADAGIKLGVSYLFGSVAEKAAPTPAPAPAQVVEQPVKVADTDGDGVPNNRDKCPNTAANHKVDADGCTIFVEKVASVGDVDIEVRFPFDSAVIPADHRFDVQNLGAFMQRFPEATVLIEGHASKIGSPEYNMKLSQRRADAVAKVLKQDFNIAQDRISTIGYGETKPRVNGSTREAHRANQRIEAKVTATIKEPVLR
ncbi:OmpA family protein [Rheinheimera sp. MMS21-TC3]|uniref:OmpA family protein n=1 Tax=Rheinheimera sp. MMS21-TC3 TaxID=3072790 RepID=UPI0028C3E019|nr:OmpA family protein [Rheinheimera sp. MMS21-TC3]WNO62136.1 OmpA family protein [Rheinheimera sp. MMS21-TC3]